MKKKKVVIIAPTGMLGNAMYKHFYTKYEVILLYRNEAYLHLLPDIANHKIIQCDLQELYEDYIKGFTTESYFTKLVQKIGDVDGVINCAGITKPHSLQSPEVTFFINGAFPHILSEVYQEKLIQIATDCVFDAVKKAPYTEEAARLPADLYGLSKSLGEPSEKSLVLRTSIIGEELHGQSLLISWLKNQKGDVFGFTNHFWNGITTKQFAIICESIISQRNTFPKAGLFHIFSNDISKYELLCLLKEKYTLTIGINKKESEPVDRRLATKYSLNDSLSIPSIQEMIEQL